VNRKQNPDAYASKRYPPHNRRKFLVELVTREQKRDEFNNRAVPSLSPLGWILDPDVVISVAKLSAVTRSSLGVRVLVQTMGNAVSQEIEAPQEACEGEKRIAAEYQATEVKSASRSWSRSAQYPVIPDALCCVLLERKAMRALLVPAGKLLFNGWLACHLAV
jgi:hypothetical protein